MGKFVEKKTVIMKQKISYKDAGVDIEKADKAIASSKETIQATFTKDVLSSVGGFGSMYSLKNVLKNYDDPVMVQSVDGVGTKVSVAQRCKNFSLIGTDLVRLEVSLVGGETAEMPGTYHKNEYDLVGVATGVVDKKNIIDGSKTKSGSVVLGLPSNGLHTNGYSLARKLIFDTLGLNPRDALPNQKTTVEHALLAPHKNYSKVINGLIDDGQNIEGIAHITGGGLIDNIPRILPDGLAAEINVGAWKKIPIFKFLANNLDLSTKELYRTFNMGIGLALVVEESKKSTMMRALENEGCVEIGKIITGPSKEVHLNEQ